MGVVAIGTVRGSEVIENKDADEKSRMLQVELTNADDLQSIEQIGQVGEDSNPQPDARVIVIDLGPAYRVAVASSDDVEPSVSEGEKEIYSYDASGNKLATIILKSDSHVEIEGIQIRVGAGATEPAMQGTKFITKYNAHTHTGAFGPTGPPIVPWTVADNSTKVKVG